MGLFEDPIEKKVYDVAYKHMKEEGYAFHPFATYKDTIVAAALLALLFFLTFFYGVHLDAPADPTSQYLPRPEWYFMWLFQLLKYFPGWTAIFPAAIIPGAIGGALILLPLYDTNPYRHWAKRKLAVVLMSGLMVSVVGLTFKAYWDDAHDPHAMALKAGGEHGGSSQPAVASAGGAADGEGLFKSKCVMCHGPEGKNMPQVDLFSKKSLEGRDIVSTIVKGSKSGAMPPQGLSEDEAKAIEKFLMDKAK